VPAGRACGHFTWAPLTFVDEAQNEARADAVARARRGAAAEAKARCQKTADGARCHSFRALLARLTTPTRITIRLPAQGDVTFELLVPPTALQRRAFELLGAAIPLLFQKTERPSARCRLFPARGRDQWGRRR